MSTSPGLQASKIARAAAPVLLVLAAMAIPPVAAAGLVAGVITMRTSSILTVLAWHAGIAVPLFAVMVCQ